MANDFQRSGAAPAVASWTALARDSFKGLAGVFAGGRRRARGLNRIVVACGRDRPAADAGAFQSRVDEVGLCAGQRPVRPALDGAARRPAVPARALRVSRGGGLMSVSWLIDWTVAVCRAGGAATRAGNRRTIAQAGGAVIFLLPPEYTIMSRMLWRTET